MHSSCVASELALGVNFDQLATHPFPQQVVLRRPRLLTPAGSLIRQQPAAAAVHGLPPHELVVLAAVVEVPGAVEPQQRQLAAPRARGPLARLLPLGPARAPWPP